MGQLNVIQSDRCRADGGRVHETNDERFCLRAVQVWACWAQYFCPPLFFLGQHRESCLFYPTKEVAAKAIYQEGRANI